MYETEVADILHTAGIEYIISLPCDRTKGLCETLESRFRYITISREEDGVGLLSGLSLAGARGVVQMQSSGLGNSLGAIMTLPWLYRLPLPILASWRGYYKEGIAAQIPFNEKIPDLLRLYQIPCTIIRGPEEIERIGTIISDAWEHKRPHVALLSPKIWEGDTEQSPGPSFPGRTREISLTYTGMIKEPVMTRADAIAVLAELLTDELVVSNIGVPSKELHHARDRPLNFYMLGSYTQASPIGLGMALGGRKKVTVLDGDGSILGTAILPVIAAENPDNLTVVCLDNGVYGSTGNQCSPAFQVVDLELLAQASGITRTCKVHSPEELRDAYQTAQQSGPTFIHVIIKPGNSEAPNIQFSPLNIRDRFTTAQ